MCFDLECPPLRLQAGAARGRHHNGLLVTSDLHEMTATRPVTRPNLHLRRLAQSPPTTTMTPHKDGRLFNAAQKKTAPRPQTKHRGQGPIATTRATCDVRRAELRLVHWVWRGRDSPAPQEHDGGLGSYFVSSVECTHRPLLRGYHHGHISRVAVLSCVFFSRHAVCSWRQPAACAVYVADRPRGVAPDAAPERR